MSSRGALTVRYAVYGGSVAFHLALATAAVLTPKPKRTESVAITLAQEPKKPPKVEAPPPPPPPPPPAAAKAKAAAPKAAVKAEAPPPADAPPPSESAAPEGFADLGVMMGNGPGGGGMAIAAAAGPAPVREATKTVRALSPKHEDACDDLPVKAKLRGAAVKPAYTNEARTAQIEGVVRVEITVGSDGHVASVKVLRGLGYGLDEAAVAAAKQMEFEPGTSCGKAATTKLTVGMRFNLE